MSTPPRVKSFKSPNTTEEEQSVTAGQRVVNLMWETTQAKIAVVTVFSSIAINSILCLTVVFMNLQVTNNQMAVISLCIQPITLTTGIVIGFYFSRTNHTAIGGTGHKPQASSVGTR